MDSDDHEKITNTLAFWTIFLWKEDRKKVVLKQQQQQPTEMRKKKIQHSKWEDIVDIPAGDRRIYSATNAHMWIV